VTIGRKLSIAVAMLGSTASTAWATTDSPSPAKTSFAYSISHTVKPLPASVIEAFALETANPRIDECAAFVAEHSLRLLPEIISGVGFCMYVTRAALDLCGLLDAEAFGRGYGEEVDFCLRASRVGMRHLAEDSTFVYHRGGVSFGEYQSEGWARSSAVIDERYPFFRPANTYERAHDPLSISFAALELGLHERDRERPGPVTTAL